MKRIIFTLLMTAISSNALAGWSVRDLSDELSTRATDRSKHAPVGMLGEWVVVGETRSYVVYADLSSIQVSGDKVTMWDMFDNKTDEQNLRGKKYLSSRSQQEFDCKAETSKQLLTAGVSWILCKRNSLMLRHPIAELNSKTIKRSFPVSYWQRPFPADILLC